MTTWFDEARFGMFVHWDHASQQGLEISWPLVGGSFALPLCQSVTVEQYHASAATFDPREWDPKALARRARRAGMRYVVFTAKHHSGYAMFHTRHSRLSIEHSPYGRDIVGELVEALREEGLRVGLYFSLSDWSHPDYPAFTEDMKPYRIGQSPPFPGPERWERFLADMFGQIRELLTNYGKIDILWFDGGWERSAAQWKASELDTMIRTLQPEILLNDRLPGVGDYDTPEQFVPAQPLWRRWETCMTMNESWGWNPGDTSWKSSRRLIHTLCEVAGKSGNLLLNVSPTGSGAIPPAELERLDAIGAWMERHGESIVATTQGLDPWQFYGPSTRSGGRIYCHLLMRPYDAVTVRGIPVRRIEAVRLLGSDARLRWSSRTGIIEGLSPDPDGELTIEIPPDATDEHATVIAIDVRSASP